MEIHRQQCQACQSFEMRIILARKEHQKPTVYVRCGHCGELVARYRLCDYYHHGKGIESFLRSQGASSAESGRRMLNEFKKVKVESVEEYAEVLRYLDEHDKSI